MNFIKTLWNNKKIVWQLGKSDFKNRFAVTSLGTVWGFLQPFIFMFTYVIVFEYILKTKSSGDYPFLVWFLPGMVMWMFLNDSILNATSSIRQYSYLVKKVVFPIDIIPNISIVSSSFVSIFLILIVTIVCIIFKYIPNIFILLYTIISAYCFIIAFTRFTSAVATMVPDFANLLSILMQLFFWFTPIIWNMDMLVNHQILDKIIRCIPFTYLVSGIRDAFLPGNIITLDFGLYTIVFWIITIFLFIWGNYVFSKNKKEFADVL